MKILARKNKRQKLVTWVEMEVIEKRKRSKTEHQVRLIKTLRENDLSKTLRRGAALALWETRANVMKNAIEIAAKFGNPKKIPQTLQLIKKFL